MDPTEEALEKQHLLELLAENKVNDLMEILKEMPTVEVADFLSEQDEVTMPWLLSLFEPQEQAFIFSDFDEELQLKVIKGYNPRELSVLVSNMHSDERADLYQNMSIEAQNNLLPYLPKQIRDNILQLSSYPEDSAGASMSSDFASVTINMTIKQAMEQIRKDAPTKETIYYIYVVDEDRKLLGFVSLKDLILASPTETIEHIIHEDIVYCKVNDDQETVASQIDKYDLIAIPVVNNELQLLGIVTHDDAIDILREEQTEDIQMIGGSEAFDEPYFDLSMFQLLKKRGGWLIILFLSEMLTATAMGFFQGEIEKQVVLALFVPLIISSGGNSGSQAATIIIRAMALGEVTLSSWWRVLKREFSSGLLLGCLLGTVGFCRIAIWELASLMQNNWILEKTIYKTHWILVAFTVGFSLIGVVMWGTLSGSMLPILLKRLGFDPAVSSAPFVATLVDVTGLIIYFSVAMIVMKGTML